MTPAAIGRLYATRAADSLPPYQGGTIGGSDTAATRPSMIDCQPPIAYCLLPIVLHREGRGEGLEHAVMVPACYAYSPRPASACGSTTPIRPIRTTARLKS